MLADTLEGLARVRRIVAGLKTFALADGEQREHLELARVVDSAVELASSVIRGRARLVREDQAVVLVDANRGRLTQVVVNLLVNGAHAIQGDAGGNELRVETRTDGAGRAVLSVRDTGVGIPPENLARIFDPFFTTRAVGAGTGLGLFIVHNVVAGLGGEISVESQMGVGTTFTVVLPAAPPP
jgi:signal transduction histidine kinase